MPSLSVAFASANVLRELKQRLNDALAVRLLGGACNVAIPGPELGILALAWTNGDPKTLGEGG